MYEPVRTANTPWRGKFSISSQPRKPCTETTKGVTVYQRVNKIDNMVTFNLQCLLSFHCACVDSLKWYTTNSSFFRPCDDNKAIYICWGRTQDALENFKVEFMSGGGGELKVLTTMETIKERGNNYANALNGRHK